MLGAIAGDIVGSVYEQHNIKTKEFPLFQKKCSFTDDTVMTAATADALMNGGTRDDFITAYKKWGRMYPCAGYGKQFKSWLRSSGNNPYSSWGNGSAMRVSPCGWILDCESAEWPPAGWEFVARSSIVTHNHSAGIIGAQATAAAIFFARQFSESHLWTLEEMKTKIRSHVEKEYGYDLSRTLDEIRPTYKFDSSCPGSVPQAITAFLESTDFEDAIRNAISLGGDSDTLAAIAGSIAEAAYGIPEQIRDEAWSYLDAPLRDICSRWESRTAQNRFPSSHASVTLN